MSKLIISEPHHEASDKPNSPVVTPDTPTFCYWNGSAYSVGSVNCIGGYMSICSPSGQWFSNINEPC